MDSNISEENHYVFKTNEALAHDWLWNPWLVADITRCINQSISRQNPRSTSQDGYVHYLEWSNSNNKIDVYLEIRDDKKHLIPLRHLIVNTDRLRSHNERLALMGIAAIYDLIYGECDDGD